MSALENPEYRRGQIRPSLRCPRESTAGDRANGADRATADLGAEDGAGRRIDAEEIRTNLAHGRAVQLGDTFWLYVVWNPFDKPDATPLIIQNPAKHLDHAKKEVVAARYFDIPADAVEQAAALFQKSDKLCL